MTIHSIRPVDDASFEAEVLASDVPVFVDFTATWCAPCKTLMPVLERLAREGREGDRRFEVVSVDGGDCPDIVTRLKVRGFPTVVLFEGGREVARHLGATNLDALRALLESA
jgi:thioredoxin 1